MLARTTEWLSQLFRLVGQALGAGAIARLTVQKEDASMAAFYLISLALGVMMVSLRGQDIGRVPLADAVRQLKLVPQSRYEDAAAFFG